MFSDHPNYDAKTDTVDGVPVRASFEELLQLIPTSAEQFEGSMQRAIGLAAQSVATQMRAEAHAGEFCFLGVDFMVDEDGHPWLLEFTKSPAVR